MEQSRHYKSDCQVPVHMFYYSATLPGCWKSQNYEARRVLCMWRHKSSLGTQGRGFNPREDFSHLQSWGNNFYNAKVPILMPVVYKLCKLWQILHNRALKFVAEFSLLLEFGAFAFRNIAHDKKRIYIKKKFQCQKILTLFLRCMPNYLGYKYLRDPSSIGAINCSTKKS